MKRIFLLILSLIVVSSGIYAKDFNKQQLELRLQVVKYLSNEGFQPKIDKDGDVLFVKNDITYYLIINENWNEPYLMTLYTEFGYDDEHNYSRSNLENCITVVAQHKVVKLYCMEESYTYRSDIFCKDAEILKSSFYSMLNEIEAARKNVSTTLFAGLGDIDITNDKNAVFDKAISFYKDEDYEKSFSLFKFLAESGYEKSFGFMGLAYELGEGTSKNVRLMKEFYNKAIESGYYWCAYRLGIYNYNEGNYDEAMSNLIKCSANENSFRSEAFFSIGKMHENGEGTEIDISKAVTCYRKSVQYASELDCDARLALMRMGEVVEPEEDFVEATKSMLMGLTPADMYEVGTEYEYGMNNRYVSLPKAYAYYKAAADKGYTKAESKMGSIYVSKYYPFQDESKSNKYYSKAVKSYRKQADKNGDACYELGYMYQNGYGVDKDMEQAKYYYKSGAMLGDRNAAWRLGLIYIDEMEYTEAYKFLLRASEAGQGMAMFELAKLYENGLGTAYNREKAIEWYKKCAESTYMARNDARNALKRLGNDDGKY